MSGQETCRFAWLGTVEFLHARAVQDVLVNGVANGECTHTLLLLEHPHVFTRGRLSSEEHLLSTATELAEAEVPVYDTDRGGQITYHGPGQLVGYPIVKLRDWGGPLQYVRTLEQVIVSTLDDFGIDAHTEEGLTGVWTKDGKIAAIGVKISRGVSFHGFAINVNTDLSYYRHIVPCGITDRPVTSMAAELERGLDLYDVRCRLIYRFGQAMDMVMADGSKELAKVAGQGLRS